MNNKASKPLVSVITAVYQGEAFVKRFVQNVLSQTYPHFEMIVVDDGSSDSTLTMLQSFKDKRLRVFQQANQGTAAARNKALKEAHGEYIAFLDSDDLWFPTYLEIAISTLLTSENRVGMAYSWYYAVDQFEQLVNLSPAHKIQGFAPDYFLDHEGVVLPSTTVIHRQIYEKLGGFQADVVHEDRVFFTHASRFFPAYPTQQRLVIYRQTEDGKCRKMLKDYHYAIACNEAIFQACKAFLKDDELAILHAFETKSLFYRFLVYNQLEGGQLLFPQLDIRKLITEKKGILAILSIYTRLNWVYWFRLAIQGILKVLFKPWWRLHTKPVYQALK